MTTPFQQLLSIYRDNSETKREQHKESGIENDAND